MTLTQHLASKKYPNSADGIQEWKRDQDFRLIIANSAEETRHIRAEKFGPKPTPASGYGSMMPTFTR